MDVSVKRKRQVMTLDIVSLLLTISCVILYTLSVLALQKFWSHDSLTREIWSIVFTAVAVAFDITSVSCDIVSFHTGRQIYKSIMNNTSDEVEQKLSHHEKLSYQYDRFSTIASSIGLTFGIASLILICVDPGNATLDTISWAISIAAASFDFISAFLLMLGINQHMKYWHVKSIVKLARESINMSNVRK